ncbi:MAG TPA: hypothetical protein DEO40_07045 [Treponema sp.]|nr:hypothetical protein [Treponema sp.]HBB43761.1 hypothetical protein [Treponema sp.]HCA20416.1 hypothetical protein [Treponema sp.]
MKKSIMLLLCALLGFTAFAATTFKSGDTVYVSAKSTSLKSGTGFMSKTVGTVNYGDALTVISVSKKKVEVKSQRNSSLKGWIPIGSITKRKIVSSGAKSAVSSQELALAGKGFTEEAENAYKASSPNLDFKAVDAIEKIRIDEETVQAFIREGHLTGGEE